MTNPKSKQKPSFRWQAVLIVLPVAVLAGFGMISLRQDKLLARKEAEERAQEIANQLVPRIWEELNRTNGDRSHSFQVSRGGDLLFPPPVAAFPEPKPFDLALLSAAQRQLWQASQAQDESNGQRSVAIESARKFLNSNPPVNFAGAAEYTLGMLLEGDKKKEDAARCFHQVATKYTQATGESGLPLAPLAEFRWLELVKFGAFSPAATNRTENAQGRLDPFFVQQNPVPFITKPISATNLHVQITNRDIVVFNLSFDSFCSNLVYHPSPMTPLLLERALKRFVPGTDFSDTVHPNTNRVWLDLWRQHEAARSLYEKARPLLKSEREFFWFGSGPEMWLGRRVAESEMAGDRGGPSPPTQRPRGEAHVAGYTVFSREESEVRHALSAIVSDYGKIPDYFGIELAIADRTVGTPHSDLRVWKEEWHASKSGGQIGKRVLSDSPVTAVPTNVPKASLLASGAHSQAGADLVRLNVYLTSPDMLFKRQTARSFWFGSLIAASAVVALVGLFRAWRAFHTQQQLNEMKSNFVSSVSHELRAPIASVRLLAESLEKGKIHEPAKQVEYFRFIGQECRRLSGLIQNVLDFSRIEQGRKQYEFEPTDIAALVKQTVELMRTYAEERKVTLRLRSEDISGGTEPLELCVDGRAIQQALINLIDNAIKHSEQGAEVVVGVEARPKPQEKSDYKNDGEWSCRIWVEDRGPGIPLNEQARIFERFYRVGSELRRETQGVGIGLSIVKHVVEAHGGTVKVNSAPGQGSTFTIELPLRNRKLE